MRCRSLLLFAIVPLLAGAASMSIAAPGDNSDKGWIVRQPEEIVGYLLFDPATVADRLPRFLRFITVEELAAGGVGWASDYLAENSSRGGWGISFLEIIRTGTFTIEGRAPAWPEGGAAALWLARVEFSDSTADLGPGVPLLMLEFWMPDSLYVAYMLDRGYYATYGDVRLHRDPKGEWKGSVNVDGLSVLADCRPRGPVTGGAEDKGRQVLVPPASFTMCAPIHVAFAGHRIQSCDESSSWKLEGAHPLAKGIILGPATFQFGYDLVGGVRRAEK